MHVVHKRLYNESESSVLRKECIKQSSITLQKAAECINATCFIYFQWSNSSGLLNTSYRNQLAMLINQLQEVRPFLSGAHSSLKRIFIPSLNPPWLTFYCVCSAKADLTVCKSPTLLSVCKNLVSTYCAMGSTRMGSYGNADL